MSGISPQQKKDPKKRDRERKKERVKKKGARIEKQKRLNQIWRSSMFQKEKRKKRIWNWHAAGRDSIKKRKERRSHFPIVQNLMCGLIHTHTSFAFALPSIPWLFPFLPHSLHHSPSTMIICHTNSLEFSFAFTIYKV
jgi:hypothetical protein